MEYRVKIEITPEVIAAVEVLRVHTKYLSTAKDLEDAIKALDNAGVFRAIDDAAYVELFGECPCPKSRATTQAPLGADMHTPGCPGDVGECDADMDFSRRQIRKCTCGYMGMDASSVPDFKHTVGCPGDSARKCTCGYLETVRRGLGGEHTRGCPGERAEATGDQEPMCTHPRGFTWADDDNGHSGSFCEGCGAEESRHG